MSDASSGTAQSGMNEGEFVRKEDAFRDWIGPHLLPATAKRYHLYVSLACPWASRCVIVRRWLGLEKVIGLTVVDPIRDGRGWAFREGPGSEKDVLNGFQFLREAYFATDPNFDGRVTVPVLWDIEQKRIVNNSEDDICRMFNDAFREFSNERNIFPADIEEEHKALTERIYDNVNNGVYKAGFADLQAVYERECRRLFAVLDELEKRLDKARYLFGERIVEADWRLFCTLIRFDVVYHGHFKCNVRRISDYANLHRYMLDLYNQPGIAETVNFNHIKRHYYFTHDDINPTRIVPIGPAFDLVLDTTAAKKIGSN
jgi:putative glutathione S-transferase